MRKPSKKSLTRRWGQIVMKKAKYICQHCGNRNAHNPHHIFTKSRNSTRFLIENGICLCTWCHVGDPYKSAHGAPKYFENWLKTHYMTKKEYDDLEFTSNMVCRPDLAAIDIYLKKEKEKLNELDN